MQQGKSIKAWVISDGSYRLTQGLEIAKHISPAMEVIDSDNYPSPKPDIVFGVGEKTAKKILEIKEETNAIAVNILDPRIDHDRFDLIILPSYEPYRERENTVTTIGLINHINPGILEKLAEKSIKYTALLVGGKHVGGDLTEEDMLNLASLCNGFSKEKDLRLLVATSKRTTAKSAAILKNNLKNIESFYEFGQPDNPYISFLARAENIIVTGDSARMMSEAASSGGKVYIYDSPNIAFRYRDLQKELIENGQASAFLENPITPAPSSLNEARRIADYIRKNFF